MLVLLPSTAAAAPPANDAFASPATLTGPTSSTPATNIDAGLEAGEPQHAGVPGGASVWFAWTAPSTATVTVDTCAAAFDTLLAVYSGTSLAALTTVASSDDACASPREASRVSFPATMGTTYKIAVAGYQGQTGSFTLALTAPAAPPNDNFANATVVTGSPMSGSNIGAGSEPGEPLHAGVPGGASVWWRWTPPSSGEAFVGSCFGSFPAILAVYRERASEPSPTSWKATAPAAPSAPRASCSSKRWRARPTTSPSTASSAKPEP